jgi:hypothetical protein
LDAIDPASLAEEPIARMLVQIERAVARSGRILDLRLASFVISLSQRPLFPNVVLPLWRFNDRFLR